MANIGSFDATSVEPSEARDFTPLPAGEYRAMVVASELKATKAGNGHYLSLEIEVIEGEYANRKVFANLNLDNPNQQAVDIAQRDLSAICHAVGVLHVEDSEQLHDKPMRIKVKVTPAKGDYPAGNKITGYSKDDGAAAPAMASSAPAASAPAASGSKPAPWAKSA